MDDAAADPAEAASALSEPDEGTAPARLARVAPDVFFDCLIRLSRFARTGAHPRCGAGSPTGAPRAA
eukprot:8642728-Alexandrium_andersonii.AAC.1